MVLSPEIHEVVLHEVFQQTNNRASNRRPAGPYTAIAALASLAVHVDSAAAISVQMQAFESSSSLKGYWLAQSLVKQCFFSVWMLCPVTLTLASYDLLNPRFVVDALSRPVINIMIGMVTTAAMYEPAARVVSQEGNTILSPTTTTMAMTMVVSANATHVLVN